MRSSAHEMRTDADDLGPGLAADEAAEAVCDGLEALNGWRRVGREFGRVRGWRLDGCRR